MDTFGTHPLLEIHFILKVSNMPNIIHNIIKVIYNANDDIKQ